MSEHTAKNVLVTADKQRSRRWSMRGGHREPQQTPPGKKEGAGKFLRQVPPSIKPLLSLANLLPVQFRHPRWWARRDTPVEDSDGSFEWYRSYEFNLFRTSWQTGESNDQRMLSCRLFLRATEALPLELQAFILEDRDGEVINEAPFFDVEPPPRYYNFEALEKSEEELKAIVRTARKRYEIAFELEAEWAIDNKGFFLVVNRLGEGRSTKLGDRRYRHTYSHVLLRRARQRLIYVVAAQETLICLTREDAQEQLERRMISSLYEGQSTLYINQEGMDRGTIRQFESPLERPFVGIEVFDYDGAERAGRKPNRIRVCPICYRIFWAGRLDAEHCGDKKCKSTFSTRLSRSPELRALYNKARRTKRAKAKAQQTSKKGK
jgi:hypothetical protein